MKKGKDEEKELSPMFPRLHVNDAEKGGPRAPPRNKMALYEQLSIPSHRFNFNSGLPYVHPLPPKDGGNLAPSASSSQGSGNEKSVVTPFCCTPASAPVAEKHHFYSLSGVNVKAGMANLEQESMKSCQVSNVARQLSPDATASGSSSRPQSLSNYKNLSQKRPRSGDESRVPVTISDYYDAPQGMNGEKYCLSLNSSMQLRSASDKQQRDLNMSPSSQDDPNRPSSSMLYRDNTLIAASSSQDDPNRPSSSRLTRGNTLTAASSSLSIKEEVFAPPKRPRTSLNKESKSSILDDVHDSLHQRSVPCLENTALPNPTEVTGKVHVPTSPKASLEYDQKSCDEVEHIFQENKKCEPLQMGGIERNDDVSNTNTAGSMLKLDISPDDAVGILGQKHFWKTRNAIVNQQRVFAVQVFELHKLIEVQKLIAGSPDVLLDKNLCSKEPLGETSPKEKLPSESVLEPPLQIGKSKDGFQKRNSNGESIVNNAVGKLAFASSADASKNVAAPLASSVDTRTNVATPLVYPSKIVTAPASVVDTGKDVTTPALSADTSKDVTTPLASLAHTAKNVTAQLASLVDARKNVTIPHALSVDNSKDVTTPLVDISKNVTAPLVDTNKNVTASLVDTSKNVIALLASSADTGKNLTTPLAPSGDASKNVTTPCAPLGDTSKNVTTPLASSVDPIRNTTSLASSVDASKNVAAQQANYRPPENQLPVTMTSGMHQNPWGFHPPTGNQWLVPVMSPSEGLIYKPYAGLCPPAPGFMVPIYGSYRPINLNAIGRNFYNPACGIPVPRQQGICTAPVNFPSGQAFFPPYGKSVVNPSSSGSVVEQANLSTGDQLSRWNNHGSAGDINATLQSMCNRSSGHMSDQKTGLIPGGFGKFQAAKVSELQDSTASTSTERAPLDALPLFPLSPTTQKSNQADRVHSNEKQTQAIKAVPRNPQSATASAAWIFRSIQEERKQKNYQGSNL